MKYYFPVSRLLWLGFSLWYLLLSTGCPNSVVSTPFLITSSNEKVKSGIGIAFIDAAGTKNVPGDIEVVIEDPQGAVLSSNGYLLNKPFIVNGGVMSVTLKAEVAFPCQFVIKARAKGYRLAIKEVIIEQEGTNYVPVYMILEEVAPQGLLFSETTLPLNGDGTLAKKFNFDAYGGTIDSNMVIGQTGNWINRSNLLLSLNAGTRLYTGNTLYGKGGRLKAQVLFGPPGSDVSNRTFPGGFMTTNAYDKNGDRLADLKSPRYFISAGWFDIKMEAEEVEIDSFSEPMEAALILNDTIPDPSRGKNLGAGSTVDLWYLRESDGAWIREGRFDVETTFGKTGTVKFVRFPLKHLSIYAVGPIAPPCNNNISFTYNGADYVAGRNYNTRLVSSVNGQYIRNPSNMAFPSPAAPLTVSGLPVGLSMKLMVSEVQPVNNQQAAVSSTVTCNTPAGALPAIPAMGRNVCLKIEFRKIADSQLFGLCNNTVWHKNMCNDPLFELANYLSGNSAVVIPNAPLQGQKCIRLWYWHETLQRQTYIEFQVPLQVALGQMQTDQQGTKEGNTPFFFNYDITSGNAADACNNILRIYVPSSIINTGNCQ
jgi:hypothetical protein